jgi:Flp pilus assembly pilin Flp
LQVLLSKERKDPFMQALFSRFAREPGVTAIEYSLITAALMLIGVGAWVVVAAPHVAASAQIEINPLQMMTNAKDLPTSHYDF